MVFLRLCCASWDGGDPGGKGGLPWMASWRWGFVDGERGHCHWCREAVRAWVLTAKAQGDGIGIAVAWTVTEVPGSKLGSSAA